MISRALAAAAVMLLLGNTGRAGNVLILVADDLGIDSVAAYGVSEDLPSTPVISALAADGVLFRNMWSNPVCSPTRGALQTGRHGFRTGIGIGVFEGGWALQTSEVTLPEMLDLAADNLTSLEKALAALLPVR